MFKRSFRLMMPLLDGGDSGQGGGDGTSGASGQGDGGGTSSGGATTDGSNNTNNSNTIFPDGLEDDIVNDPSLKVFVSDNKLDMANLIKSYVHAQKKMGADKIVLPGKNADEKEWEQVYNKLGRPAIDKYDIKAEGLDAETINAFKAQAHKAGLLPRQAQAVLDWNIGQAKSRAAAAQKVADEHFSKQLGELKSEWADAFDSNLSIANRALKEFATPDELAYFKETGLADNIALVKLFNRIGKGLKEDTFDKEAHGSFGLSKEAAQSKINELYADFNGPYYNSDHPGHKSTVDQMYKLQEILLR